MVSEMAQPVGILDIGADLRGEDEGKLKQFQDIRRKRAGGNDIP